MEREAKAHSGWAPSSANREGAASSAVASAASSLPSAQQHQKPPPWESVRKMKSWRLREPTHTNAGAPVATCVGYCGCPVFTLSYPFIEIH